MTGHPLGRLDEVPEDGSAAFVIGEKEAKRGFMAIRQGSRLYVYENRCPHVTMPLDFVPGRFLNAERTHILCANHGALFRIDDGVCVSGPCLGKALTAVAFQVVEGTIMVKDEGTTGDAA